jgi:hypothetical protein
MPALHWNHRRGGARELAGSQTMGTARVWSRVRRTPFTAPPGMTGWKPVTAANRRCLHCNRLQPVPAVRRAALPAIFPCARREILRQRLRMTNSLSRVLKCKKSSDMPESLSLEFLSMHSTNPPWRSADTAIPHVRIRGGAMGNHGPYSDRRLLTPGWVGMTREITRSQGRNFSDTVPAS